MKITHVAIWSKASFEGLKLLAAEAATLDAAFVTRDLNRAFLARGGNDVVVIELTEKE